MGMDFHNQQNRLTYTAREANKSWIETISKLISINDISKAADIGCGGGIYSKAMADVGVTSVTGVDFSEAMLEGAKEYCEGYENISLRYGNALETGLDDNSYDLVLERALIHHIKDLQPCFEEAYRILQNDGIYIVQDRTPEDCLLEGDENHIRGYFFELFPQLIEKETRRRFHSQFVIKTLKAAGFKHIKEEKFWEVRKVYENKEQLFKDLSERTGRSILHELDDEELKSLITHIDKSISTDQDLIEKDRWTVWKAVK
ncbi:methyltransferase domain-containing protein [Virgibacillus halodenitrificans]|uniref:class I SAM-dependent methyltransferase n=1 Tax=Virgibacillus halodenitrificans TaxID=1482 RepID=UPI00045CB2BD|nr:class I SAM-dependent methyltransferase [Virgibacillus halodenitrificans]MCG1028776.1 methyltransferase domain-containing protein [Virgibacillus halodenitrificans]CDQ32536.1 Demethylmenaquinone methyltransferase [Virgibacillus halodenitrificans]